MHSHSYAHRILQTLPLEFQEAFRIAQGRGDDDDLLQELALAALAGRTPEFARSAARRFEDGGQAPRRMLEIDEERAAQIEAEEADVSGLDFDFGALVDAGEIAKRFGVGRRRAYQLIQKQIAQAEACGDLFCGAALL